MLKIHRPNLNISIRDISSGWDFLSLETIFRNSLKDTEKPVLSQVTLPASSVAWNTQHYYRIIVFFYYYYLFNLEVETKTFNDGLELSDVEDSILISVKQLGNKWILDYNFQTTGSVSECHSLETSTAIPQIHLPRCQAPPIKVCYV